MKVVIDSREKNRVQSASKYYKEQGLEIEIAELPVGDYVFDDKVCFEFKLISDFISSIQDGRLYNQTVNMSENYNHHFIILHGDLYTRHKCLAMTKHYRPVTIYQYLASIASLNRWTTVIETYNPTIEESYHRMLVQANKCLSSKPLIKKFPRKSKNPAFNYLCYCVYGINAKKAQLICDTYNLVSLTDLMKLTQVDLTQIEGIGPKTADNIIRSLL